MLLNHQNVNPFQEIDATVKDFDIGFQSKVEILPFEHMYN